MMADFDPDAYLAKSDHGFDPDAYLAGDAELAPPAPHNVPYHIARTDLPIDQTQYDTIDASAQPPRINGNQAEILGQVGGMMGMGDELAAGAKSVIDTATTPEKKWSNLLQTYRANKKNAQSDITQARAQQPLRYFAGNIPATIGTTVAASAIAPAAVGEQVAAAAPRAVNAISNLGISAIQNFGDDTFKTSKVLGDAFTMQAGGEILGALARPGKSAGELLQAPQKAVDFAAEHIGGTKIGKVFGQNADDIGEQASKKVKDLRVAQQSYLTQAGKEGAAAESAVSGSDFPSRLAKSASQGAADISPGSFVAPAAEFGEDLSKIHVGGMDQAIKDFGPKPSDFAAAQMEAKPYLKYEDPVSAMRSDNFQGFADRVNTAAGRNIADETTFALGQARDTLAKYQAARAAQQTAQSGADAAGTRLQNIKTGRGALQNAIGMGTAALGGNAIGGPIGAALIAGIGGKQLGKNAFGSIDMAGELGQKLAETASVAERWATQGGELGAAARWALSAQGPALVARLAVLARLQAAQQALQTPQAEP